MKQINHLKLVSCCPPDLTSIISSSSSSWYWRHWSHLPLYGLAPAVRVSKCCAELLARARRRQRAPCGVPCEVMVAGPGAQVARGRGLVSREGRHAWHQGQVTMGRRGPRGRGASTVHIQGRRGTIASVIAMHLKWIDYHLCDEGKQGG